MKFGVVIFPGSNCDEDMIHVIKEGYKQEVVKLWHKDRDLQGCDFIILPGGFSYGDYLRSGAIARFSPIMEEVIAFANRGGYVMGICNGFQVLCESQLLPGALLRNDGRLFKCENVYIASQNNDTPVTSQAPLGRALKIPIAHGEGRFYCDETTLSSLRANQQIIYKYCNANGEVIADANPNGSLENIAGICNVGRNVFGMMPHPERASSSDLGNIDGTFIFEGIMQLAGVSA
jgi:phosphoribosylformylglycinamidine synthase